MPDYAATNHLNATRSLPDFYWTGETDMACLAHAIGQTKRLAYAHHIQRLMVTGNFALLIGVVPEEICAWYLAVYADAYEWVELPNTHGMVMYADGGVMASKPYAASGSYIDRMGDYCADCRYSVKQKTGPDACPFNYLYWAFLMDNEAVLKGNPRMGMILKTLERMDRDRRRTIRHDADTFLKRLSDHGTDRAADPTDGSHGAGDGKTGSEPGTGKGGQGPGKTGKAGRSKSGKADRSKTAGASPRQGRLAV
jgi:deoxyribodipyrimidine photolyase-related protein